MFLSSNTIESFNTKVEVLDDLGYCYVVRVKDTEGFMDKSRLARWPIDAGTGGGSTGADGGDISLQYQGGIVLLAAIEQKGDVTGQAAVLADGTEIVLGYFSRGEQIPMVAEPAGHGSAAGGQSPPPE